MPCIAKRSEPAVSIGGLVAVSFTLGLTAASVALAQAASREPAVQPRCPGAYNPLSRRPELREGCPCPNLE